LIRRRSQMGGALFLKARTMTAEITTKPATAMLSVFDGRACIGHIVRRHWVEGWAVAFEAFDNDDHSLGIFPSDQEAAAAIWRRARGQAGRP
jgi:hypothetical protein